MKINPPGERIHMVSHVKKKKISPEISKKIKNLEKLPWQKYKRANNLDP